MTAHAVHAASTGVNRVDYDTGYFLNVSPGKWQEFNTASNKAIFFFDELERTDDRIKLIDRSRGIIIVFDLPSREILYGPNQEATPTAWKQIVAVSRQSTPSPSAGAQIEQPAGPTTNLTPANFGSCKTCVFVMERIKKGTSAQLSSICAELYTRYPNAYSYCQQALNAMQLNSSDVRYWLSEGCYKYEVYQTKEWVKPCPSHVICSVLKKTNGEPFCKALPMEDPFKDDK